MAAHIGTRSLSLDELCSLPWTREIVPDGDGFFGRIQELEGCISEGSTAEEVLENLQDALRCWLEVAIEQGTPIPVPRSDLEDFSGRFSVRVPRTLHRALATRAEREGVSLNQLITLLLGTSTAKADDGLSNTRSHEDMPVTDVHEEIAADAVREDSQGIGALKGIATWLRNRGDINLASVLYALAGDRAAALTGDQHAAASDFGMAGALARRHRRMRLAEALWRESISRDPTNIRSRSALGQLLQRQGRFTESIELLESVADVDNYAQLSLGWSLLHQGLATENDESTDKGLAHFVTAMRRWCAYANRAQLSPWLRQLARLNAMGPRFSNEVDHLLSFANSNANWGKVVRGNLDAVSLGDEASEDAYEQEALQGIT
ncbi:hypothetical protein GCM10009530_56610 [Microbispora corallina]|uniref:Type II toxin-antitoxin system HicB family antitoxin n=1 Tax=Microbispora corallina TaxID=83302 RepID=A0ABQ4G8Y2_9ACTN|nr:toxin-antitoxin system HicB family antitoxin [Microbispora corallina]GIH43517.1 hypothetical protein Mco01_65170 [Microbispora corallina]